MPGQLYNETHGPAGHFAEQVSFFLGAKATKSESYKRKLQKATKSYKMKGDVTWDELRLLLLTRDGWIG